RVAQHWPLHIAHPPFACFEKAILGWCERYGV
ncbi:hypothetical protein ACUOFC_21085, partial [Escherichia sp. TWPC-MK]